MKRYSFTQDGHSASSSFASHLPVASSSRMHMTGDGYCDIDPSALNFGSWSDNQSEGPTAYPNTADSAPFYHNPHFLYPTKSMAGPGAIIPPLRSSRIQPAPGGGVLVMPPFDSHGPQGEPHQNPVAAITIEEQHNVAANGSALPPPPTSTLPALKWRAAWVCQPRISLPVPAPRTSELENSKRRERKQRASDEVADASSSKNAAAVSEEPVMLKFVNLVDQLHSKNVRTQTKQGTLSQWRCDRCQVNYAKKFALTRHQLKCAPKDKIIEKAGSAAVEGQGNKRKTPHTVTARNNTAELSVTKKARKGKPRKAEEVSGQASPIQRGLSLPAAEFSFRMSRPSSQATKATSQNNNSLVHEPHVSSEIDQAHHTQAPMPIQPPHMSIRYNPNSQLPGLHQDVANWSHSVRPAHAGTFNLYAPPEYGPPPVLVGRRTQAHFGGIQNQAYYLGPSQEPGDFSQYTQSTRGDHHYAVAAIPSGQAQSVMQPIDGYSSSTMQSPSYPFDGRMQAAYPYQQPEQHSGGDYASSYNPYYHQHDKSTYHHKLALDGYPHIGAPTLVSHTQTFEATYLPDILPLGTHAQAWNVAQETTFQPIESFGLPATHGQQTVQEAQTSASSVSQGSGMPDQNAEHVLPGGSRVLAITVEGPPALPLVPEPHALSDDNAFDDEFAEHGSSPSKEAEIIAIEELQVSALVPEAPIPNVDESDDEFGDLFTERGSSPLKQVENEPPRATSGVAGASPSRRLKRTTSSSNLF